MLPANTGLSQNKEVLTTVITKSNCLISRLNIRIISILYKKYIGSIYGVPPQLTSLHEAVISSSRNASRFYDIPFVAPALRGLGVNHAKGR